MDLQTLAEHFDNPYHRVAILRVLYGACSVRQELAEQREPLPDKLTYEEARALGERFFDASLSVAMTEGRPVCSASLEVLACFSPRYPERLRRIEACLSSVHSEEGRSALVRAIVRSTELALGLQMLSAGDARHMFRHFFQYAADLKHEGYAAQLYAALLSAWSNLTGSDTRADAPWSFSILMTAVERFDQPHNRILILGGLLRVSAAEDIRRYAIERLFEIVRSSVLGHETQIEAFIRLYTAPLPTDELAEQQIGRAHV
jgi:hypothetical protein